MLELIKSSHDQVASKLKMERSLLVLTLFAFNGVQSESSSVCSTVPAPVDEPCCKIKLPFVATDMGKVMKECKDELKLDTKQLTNPATETPSGCLDECVLTKSKLLTPELKLNEAAIKEAHSKAFTGPGTDAETKILDECLKTAAEKVPKDAKCKSGSMQFMKCMTRGIFMNCPKEKWTESDKCKAQRERLEKCPDSLPPPLKYME